MPSAFCGPAAAPRAANVPAGNVRSSALCVGGLRRSDRSQSFRHAPRAADARAPLRPSAAGSEPSLRRSSLFVPAVRFGVSCDASDARSSPPIQPALPSAQPLHRPVKVKFPRIDANSIRHPLDLEATRVLQAVPGVNQFVRDVLGNMTSQIMYLENIGSGLLVSEKQLPNLHKLLVEACAILDMEAPQLYVRQAAEPNAYTLAISGKKPFIVVTTALVELLTEDELQAVIAHELGHLKCDHGVYLTAANIVVAAVSAPFWSRWLAAPMEQMLMRWSRCAELTCDRAALLVAGGDARRIVSLLMKLTGGSPSLAPHLNVDAFLEQARAYEAALPGRVGDFLKEAHSTVMTHPIPVLRAREVDRFAASPQFQALLRRAVPLHPAPARPPPAPAPAAPPAPSA